MASSGSATRTVRRAAATVAISAADVAGLEALGGRQVERLIQQPADGGDVGVDDLAGVLAALEPVRLAVDKVHVARERLAGADGQEIGRAHV